MATGGPRSGEPRGDGVYNNASRQRTKFVGRKGARRSVEALGSSQPPRRAWPSKLVTAFFGHGEARLVINLSHDVNVGSLIRVHFGQSVYCLVQKGLVVSGQRIGHSGCRCHDDF